jgi:tartrate-resistant acid phosphatase type 5
MRTSLALLAVVLLQHYASALHFVSVGDWGDNSIAGMERQQVVAEAISGWCGSHDCAFIQSTGDNIYPDGVTSATDPRFETSWRSVYDLANIATKQWYISIGNHDHGPDDGREQFQIEYGLTEPRWYYPSLWYDLHYTDGVTHLHLIIIDSESLRLDKNNPAVQLSWLETTLAGSTTDDWKIVIDHHPAYSVGDHGPTDSTIVRDVIPLLEQYDVDLFLSGHEHNLEHLTNTADSTIDYVISGGGGRSLYRYSAVNEAFLNSIGINLDYFGYVYGFVAFDFTPTTYTADFVDDAGTIVYSYSRSK